MTTTLKSGHAMPMVGLGTAHSLEHEVLAAILAGARHLDSARIYGNERAVGNAIRRSGVARSEFFVTTKVWNDSHDRAEESVLESLEDLGLDYVDLVLVHWPTSWQRGTFFVPHHRQNVVASVTWPALASLEARGKVRSLGVSNFDESQLEPLLELEPPCCVNQIEAHPFFQNSALVAYCASKGVQCVAWGPLAKGRRALATDTRVFAVARMHGLSPAAVALRWNLDRNVAVVPKSTRPDNVRANLSVASAKPLAPHDARLLLQCHTGRRRVPDLIAIWPATAHPLAKAFGSFVALLARCLFFLSGPVDFVAFAKRRAQAKEDKYQQLLRRSSSSSSAPNRPPSPPPPQKEEDDGPSSSPPVERR